MKIPSNYTIEEISKELPQEIQDLINPSIKELLELRDLKTRAEEAFDDIIDLLDRDTEDPEELKEWIVETLKQNEIQLYFNVSKF
jgi:hypothetical protein